MPSIEKHVQYCVEEFGKENEALCYQINSWMDAPSRKMGSKHRVARHELERTIAMAIREFLSKKELKELERFLSPKILSWFTAKIFHAPIWDDGKLRWREKEEWKYKAGLIAKIVIQHLMLDGLLTERDLDKLRRRGIDIRV